MDSLQALRAIDKFDKIGREGAVELLQKPVDEFGAGAMEWQAEVIARLLDCKGASNEETLRQLGDHRTQIGVVRTRIDLMAALEESADSDGVTAWDRLLALPPNDDETWNGGGRPKNIAWALDDLLAWIGRAA